MGAGRAWSQKEIEYLQEKWGYISVSAIAKKLGRTETAVILKAKRLGLGSAYTSGEYINANQIAELLKIDRHTVTDYWIARCGLKAQKRVMRKKFAMWLVKFDEFVKWLKENQDKWDSRKLELFALGKEPEWLKEKRERDKKIPKRRFQKWTKAEDRELIRLFKAGYRHREIGEILGRSRNAVEKRLSRLDIWGTGEYIGDRVS